MSVRRRTIFIISSILIGIILLNTSINRKHNKSFSKEKQEEDLPDFPNKPGYPGYESPIRYSELKD